jgi:N-dimethylarginine dimethylaminohydrolase
MARTILMGDPAHFAVRGGANPHTRNALGLRKRVDADRARAQWHALARTLVAHGVEVCVLPPDARRTGLVYPANAGFLFPLEGGGEKIFYLSHLLPTRAAELEVYRPFIAAMGYQTREVAAPFEGEADFFPAGRFMIFTHGRVERQRFVARAGIPPWKRVYGFRSAIGALDQLETAARGREILPLELALEAHYHGDTVLCSFGPGRQYLLAYLDGLSKPSRARLEAEFGDHLIALGAGDAALYAANSFQSELNAILYLFMPRGISAELLAAVRERGAEPVLCDASEFLAKGGGSIKCMILDLGPRAEQPAAGAAFRAAHSYERLFGPAADASRSE